MLIVALGYHDGVGKDTFTTLCYDHLRTLGPKGLHVETEAFAERLYATCQSLYGHAGFKSRMYYVKNPAEKSVPLKALLIDGRHPTPRDLLLGLGEHVRRFDPHAWLRPVLAPGDADVKFIPDLRAREEFYAVEEMGGLTVRIDCPLVAPSKRLVDDRITECDFGVAVKNAGTIADFSAVAREFVKDVILPRVLASRGAK